VQWARQGERMSNTNGNSSDASPIYAQPGIPELSDYGPAWVRDLADDVTIEGSAMIGAVQGADAVLAIVSYIRSLYDDQQFRFAGPYGDNGFLEDYTAWVDGAPIGNVVLVSRNAAGQATHIVANYRPRDALLRISRLVGAHFAGAPYAKHFAGVEDGD
jgi:hypothetical protein